MDEKIKKLHNELEIYMGETLPEEVSNKIYSIINSHETDSEEVYTFMNQIFTAGEYLSTITLYDTLYESRIHNYYTKDKLVYSYKPIKTGIFKNHRIRNSRGMFNRIKDVIEPPKINLDDKNIFLIETRSFDSHEDQNVKITYTIFIYTRDESKELESRSNSIKLIAKLKEELAKGME